MRRRLTLLVAAAWIAAAAGCSLLTDLSGLSSGVADGGGVGKGDAGADAPRSEDGAPPPSDAGPVLGRCDPTKPFGAPVPLTTLNLPGDDDRAARLTPDELTIYFASDRTGERRIYRATRATVDAPFGAPTMLDELTTPGGIDFLTATPSADGLELFVEQRPSAGGGASDLRRLTRAAPAGPFGSGADLDSVNTSANETDPNLGGGDLELWLARTGATADIFIAKRATLASAFGPANPLAGSVNTTSSHESDPVPSADGLELFFQSDRGGPARIWVARRSVASEPLGTPVHVAELDGRGVNDVPNWLSSDRCVLYMTSYDQNALADLFVATRPR